MRKLPMWWTAGTALLLSAAALQPPQCVAQLAATTPARADTTDLFRLLGYTVQESGPLRFAGRERGTILLTESGAAAGAPGAVMEVFPEHVFDRIEPPERVARKGVAAAAGVRSVAIRSGRVITIDGMAGYEVVAAAVDSATGAPLTLYNAVVPSKTGHVHFRGRVDAGREGEILLVFPGGHRQLPAHGRYPRRAGRRALRGHGWGESHQLLIETHLPPRYRYR